MQLLLLVLLPLSQDSKSETR
uniref:Ebe1 n=1 Tax=Arundo donax TaxID=35708 RepID=A0A0A9FSP7_ARUDO